VTHTNNTEAKAVSEHDPKAAASDSEKNSYYYFLLSQLKDVPGKETESDAILNEALIKDASSPFLLGQRSLRKARKADFVSALADAKKALAKNPNDPDLLLLVGKLYAAQKQASTAITYYHKAQVRAPNNQEINNVLAREYMSLGNEAAAIGALKTCLARDPDSLSCLYYLATIYMEAKQTGLALIYYNQIAALSPDNAKVLQIIAGIYLEQKNSAKAIAALEKLKKVSPEDISSQIRLGLLYTEIKQPDKAITEFEALAKSFPEADRLHYFLGLLYMEKKAFEKAVPHFSQVGKSSKFYFESVLRQGLLLKEQGKTGQAIRLLDKKLNTTNAQNPEWFELKSSFLVFEAAYPRALKILTQGLAQFPGDEKLLFQRAIVFDKMNRWPEARNDLETILKANPHSAKALNYLGYTLAERGEDLALALKTLKQAIQLNPNDGYIIDSLAWAYFKNGHAAQALTLLLKAQHIVPNEPTIAEHLGDVYKKIQKPILAQASFEKALNLLKAKTDPSADETRQIKSLEAKLRAH
jgi:tetratricopeptide (TPR) repeat protein